jgi:hypothetical protein
MGDIQAQRQEFTWELDGWSLMGQVRPRVSWNRTPPGWVLNLDAVGTGPNLFGLLSLYIASEVAGAGTAGVFCTSCGRFYTPNRRPNPCRSNYCQQCRGETGKNAAWRDASRRYRRRRAERDRRG